MPSACHHCGHASNWHRITCPSRTCRLPKLRTQLRLHGINNSTLVDIVHDQTTFMDILTHYNRRNGTRYTALWDDARPRRKIDNFAFVSRKWVRENSEHLYVDWPGKEAAEENAMAQALRSNQGYSHRSGDRYADGEDREEGGWAVAPTTKSKGAARFKASKAFRN
ncbi:hypothetical protein ASPCAL09721 [Aspergillus calidoustus]|uniref:Uncharacterized protein n=1 Tax=Aspergillus calidoustus TaxID=454130 RepID=A0A0U5GZ07_ASPCI|nr:hypothetical protein ASPCAL09721 [Aspergillus calidoustus]